ncbi:MAG: helix-turn-helix domain-containing protein [Lachnospiraceae bacterium]|nr:helix-turn-helix domain-containing protein [Lachnospiraceae bacterium]
MAFRISEGIYKLYNDRNELDLLKKTVGTNDLDPSEFLHDWLFDREGKIGQSITEDIQSSTSTPFNKRFELAMQLAGMSNIKLSKLVNVDASLISRYRSGGRTPRSNSDIIVRIGEALWQNIIKNQAVSKLLTYTGSDRENATEEEFFRWLFGLDSHRDVEISAAVRLLKMIDSYSVPEHKDQVSGDRSKLYEMSSVSKRTYRGFKGLQESVICFLINVIRAGSKEICLYSDQDMDWMISDNAFLLKWAALMEECVKNGIHIRIIHNIDRNLDEMIEAIGMWLPLYMSGMIEPYFCKKPKDSRFSNTIFLCPDNFCIEASHVIGTESEGFYYFREDKAHLALAKQSFDKLMENTESLITFSNVHERILPGKLKNIEDDHFYTDDEYKNIRFFIDDDRVIIVHLSNPSLIFEFTHALMVRAFRAYTSHNK